MIFPREFHMLSQEGYLTKASLLAGIEAVGKLDYDRLETFYPAFFQLSIGLERLMKIAVILDYKVKNDLQNPPGRQIRSLGHDLVQGYLVCQNLAMSRGQSQVLWFAPDTIEHDFICHFSEFARGARYFNLDSFGSSQQFLDPVVIWARLQQRVADMYIPGVRQAKINQLAVDFCDQHGLFGFERSITGEYRTQVDCTFIHELFRISNKYCVWIIFLILKPFYRLLEDLCVEIRDIEEAQGIDTYTVPDMQEFFAFMLCDKGTATRRQKWVGIY